MKTGATILTEALLKYRVGASATDVVAATVDATITVGARDSTEHWLMGRGIEIVDELISVCAALQG